MWRSTAKADGRLRENSSSAEGLDEVRYEPERSGEDRDVKPEEDGDEQMITGSHPVVVRMSSGVEPEHQDDRKVSLEVTKGVRWKRPENPDVKEDRRLRPDEPDTEARSHVQRRECRRAKSREKPERERGPENGSLNSRRARLLTDKQFRWSGGGTATEVVKGGANTEGMNEGGREPEVQQKSQKKVKMKVSEIHQKVTVADERTSPITRPEVVGEIVAELFRLRNLLHVCPTVEPERTEVTERRFGGRNFRVGIWHKWKP
ncbi:hypothetical protein K438DRAFT_1788092 [Mycena galopus ATCC 62051]|nr:hypothetical protein K438DRAFT_1788092 [Mycena galopus ATCC 62051]